ncbi:uncharacterized protein JCM10292_001033 [Rhodotorula paludigena]|uniref:uncharacterized protein n=1 Tax=Rhodotorula paludigena TaxID=86838 RepID=UPI003178B244
MAPLSADVKGTFASAAIVVLSCPTPLPSDLHLRVADNYNVWAIQMRALAGAPAYRIMTGATLRAQGAFRLLTHFWLLLLPSALPETYEIFAKEYKAHLTTIKAAKVTGVGLLHLQLKDGLRVNLKRALLVLGISATLVLALQLFNNHGIKAIFGKAACLTLDDVLAAPATEDVKGLGFAKEKDSSCSAPCNACHAARFTRLPFPSSDRETAEPLELVYWDDLTINRPSKLSLRSSNDVLAAFQRFKLRAELECGRPIKRLRIDDNGKYTSHAFLDYAAKHGISLEPTRSYLLQTKGLAKRVNRTIAGGVLVFLEHAGAPKHLLAEALAASTHVKNRSPHAALAGQVPLAMWRKFVEHKFPFADSAPAAVAPTAAGKALVFWSAKVRVNAEPAPPAPAPASLTPQPGVNFRKTFAPVAGSTLIPTLLALAARSGLLVHQADVDKAYLHGKLNKELYMRVPDSIDNLSLTNKVLMLNRALYGLKQAGWVWYHRIHASLELLSYTRTKSNACIYTNQVKGGLKAKYGIKDLGEAKFILGIQVHHCADGSMFLSQRAYLEDLARLGQAGRRTVPTPMVPNQQLRPATNNNHLLPDLCRHYLQAVGSLMCTRPNLAHVVSVLGRNSACPDQHHWVTVVRACQYIEGTLDYGVKYVPDNLPLHFVQEMVNNGVLEVTCIPTTIMMVNAITKLLLLSAFLAHRSAMGV